MAKRFGECTWRGCIGTDTDNDQNEGGPTGCLGQHYTICNIQLYNTGIKNRSRTEYTEKIEWNREIRLQQQVQNLERQLGTRRLLERSGLQG